ncbi:wiskott-Aldrich syndrome protein family member 3-like [Siniperca chuatsi]|uniref:wiskott-Aldrich syndrome protein family member 3-like n=1 Tax=Siniperca chuatsi TaxID=119488 RepID=UPI001CE1E7EA|nr:wiskott-Aldrich syndrome protein family member 3-like [Siniperca chuatsi]
MTMEYKATAPSPPPPPPPTCGNQPCTIGSPLCPEHAAIPINSKQSLPVQETNPSSETLYHADDAPASPLLPEQSGPESPLSQGQEDNPSDSEEKHGPVQETDPAPQMTEQQDEADIQMDQISEDQLP